MSDVPLVLNPFTGSITPQWNVVIDDWFATVATSVDDLPDFNADEWSKTFGAHTYHFSEEPGEESETDLHVKPVKSIKQEYPQMEEVPWYTTPTNAIKGSSWINGPQLPQSNDTMPVQSTSQMKPQIPPTSQMTQPITHPVTPLNTQAPTSNTQSLPIKQTTSTPITKLQTPPLSTRSISVPTQAQVVPVVTHPIATT